MTVAQMTESLTLRQDEIIASLNQLHQEKYVKSYMFQGEKYYQAL